MADIAPFGSWRSPISALGVAADEVPLLHISCVGQEVYWLEGRPREGGRYVLVRFSASGERTEVTPQPFNVRTRAHEYGGGAYLATASSIFFSNFADQRLYRQDSGGQPQPITPEPESPSADRFADARVTIDEQLLVCVRERHPIDGTEARNELVVLPTDGSAAPRAIVSGHDFFSSPRISPNGEQLAWLTWDHPRMPWDGTELWIGDFQSDGSVANPRQIAGGPRESIFQPEWSPSGVLHFISDRTGWWNLYRLQHDAAEALAPMDAEFGAPQWVFGMSRYAFLSGGVIAVQYSRDGFDHLALLRPGESLARVDLPYSVLASTLSANGETLVTIAASPTEAPCAVRITPSTGAVEVLGRSVDDDVDSAYLALPQPITFPTDQGRATAHALYYPPTNADFVGPSGELPPLIVISHGGPTAMTSAQLNLELQFWTSRGFGVVDVNYGGSSGFGRTYRERLNGMWGIVDTDDCINAARYLAQRGDVDGDRLAIRGGSAGGYTTLCALVFHDDFAAGASYYGVADCAALAADTHKFESHYLDGLIGPWPASRDVYHERSPIHHADRLSCPVILFQGLQDQVVPPAQAEAMVEALRAKGLPFAYLPFEGEQHGFRKAETIRRALEAELFFYARIFNFELGDQIEPVPIENLPAG
jgi:dipeptidyl aminopeptidase/acylaminoacyl peptidase